MIFIIYFCVIILICIIISYIISFIYINNCRIRFCIIYLGFILNFSIIIYQSIITPRIVYRLIIIFNCRIDFSITCRIIKNRAISGSIITCCIINPLTILFSNQTHTNIIFFKFFFINFLIILIIFFIQNKIKWIFIANSN